MKKKTIIAAALIAGASTLTACGASLDGSYTGTTDLGEGLSAKWDLTIDGDTCTMTGTAPLIGAMPLECSVQDDETLVLDGEPVTIARDGDTIRLADPTGEDENEIVLEKIN